MNVLSRHLKPLLAVMLLAIAGALPMVAAKPIFTNDNYYKLAVEALADKLLTETGPSTVAMQPAAESKPQQLWSLSELSGSWRIINSASNLAVRYEGDRIELGANNGSDEAQLWKIDGGLIMPANKPGYAVAVEGDNLRLVALSKAKGSKTAYSHSPLWLPRVREMTPMRPVEPTIGRTRPSLAKTKSRV